MQFLTKKQKEIKLQIVTSNSLITNINSTKFLGLTIDSTLSWKERITELTSKLNKAHYAIRTLKASTSPEVLRTIYFSYFHTIMTYGIIFWGLFYQYQHLQNPKKDTENHDKYQKAGIVPIHIEKVKNTSLPITIYPILTKFCD